MRFRFAGMAQTVFVLLGNCNYDDNRQALKDSKEMMVDLFLERGFTYFDTAYMYHTFKSEEVTEVLEIPNGQL